MVIKPRTGPDGSTFGLETQGQPVALAVVEQVDQLAAIVCRHEGQALAPRDDGCGKSAPSHPVSRVFGGQSPR